MVGVESKERGRVSSVQRQGGYKRAAVRRVCQGGLLEQTQTGPGGGDAQAAECSETLDRALDFLHSVGQGLSQQCIFSKDKMTSTDIWITN